MARVSKKKAVEILDLLREEYPEADWRNPKFGRTEYGKPYLSNHPNIQFNISHCSAGVTCALADVPVGVDMEMRFGWKEKLAQRMCHPEEFAWLMQLDAIKEISEGGEE